MNRRNRRVLPVLLLLSISFFDAFAATNRFTAVDLNTPRAFPEGFVADPPRW